MGNEHGVQAQIAYDGMEVVLREPEQEGRRRP
jgi:hypothetical protein